MNTANTTNKKRLSKIARQKIAMRDSLWPDIEECDLWRREVSAGWFSMPRTMPLLMRIMDNLSKGKPVSQTYLDIWCRTYDDSFVIANKDSEMAFFSGFSGERAVRTWTDRIRTLQRLGFIKVAEGPNGPISYLLVLNPYRVIWRLHEKGQVNESSYNALKQRMIDTGADDLGKVEAKETGKLSQSRRRKRK